MSLKVVVATLLIVVILCGIVVVFERRGQIDFFVESEYIIMSSENRYNLYKELKLGDQKKSKLLLDAMIYSEITSLSYIVLETQNLLNWKTVDLDINKLIKNSCKSILKYHELFQSSQDYDYVFDSYNKNALYKCNLSE